MNKEDVAEVIGYFIGKYHTDTGKVELPVWDFTIKSIHGVKVSEESLKEVSTNLLTFEATAEIEKTDDRSTLPCNEPVKLVGNAKITPYIAVGTKEELPEVNFVTITQITKLKQS